MHVEVNYQELRKGQNTPLRDVLGDGLNRIAIRVLVLTASFQIAMDDQAK
jgi:hypothetical protein